MKQLNHQRRYSTSRTAIVTRQTATQPVCLTGMAIAATALAAVAVATTSVMAEDFEIDDGDVDALIAAINEANSNGEPDTIHLAENSQYLLEVIVGDSSGLPRIESAITIDGNGSTIERSSEDGTPNFRFFYVVSGSSFPDADGDLTLKDLTLDNGSSSHGGAIRNWGGTLTLIGCTLSNNIAASNGGAIHSDNGGENTFNDSTLIGNTASRGGAMNKHGSGGSVSITDSVIADNVSTGGTGGGGLFIESSGTHTITGTVVSGNQALGGNFAHGGGIRVQSTSLTVTDCSIHSNTSSGGGGGYYGGSLTITGTTVSDNSAQATSYGGGGIRTTSSLNMTNCTVSGNTTAQSGGGILVGGSANITNSTIANNTADSQGAGLILFAPTNFSNTIVAYNSGAADIHHVHNCNDLGYNIVEDGSGISEETSMSGDPMLGPLADNGGPTMTHALLPGSPALVNGDCAGGEITFDQRGMPRPQCNFCDIGAFEFAGLPSFGDLNCDGSIDGADLAVLLGQWGPCDSCREPDDCSADLDGNCQVDGADLAILLGNWSQ